MNAASKPAPEQKDPEHASRGIRFVSALAPAVTNAALITWNWERPEALRALVALAVAMPVMNLGVAGALARRFGHPTADAVRMLANTLAFWVTGHFTQWAPLVWIYLPYNMLWLQSRDRWVVPRVFGFLVLTASYALWDGAPLEMVVGFGLLGTFGYLFTSRRQWLQQQAVAQVEEQRQELEQAHQRLQHAHARALEQEKLSSLGLMAAGVAHELNNPMSFVTSNLSLLLKDLKQQPSLPAPLQEYVDEVLPETLEGIRRVNAIVGDLRRFARGDPEAFADYDLNTQVAAALRIAHPQLGHCRVEESLGEVDKLMGRPQQIVQVLVNMLVNAGQATQPGGQVRVSTHREAEGARVEIRDTGPGLSEEARRHLFQPFFTTRPHGTGMGLGLAVVHGIVTAHGGRIEVDSQPGQGACFTVHLPRTPPQPAFRRSPDVAGSPVVA
jgi:signal transduction histidine kinase